ncbi:MAG: hypothetical protein GY750_01790 [Lentisphaerae bacterium]|nr:hypothetical protein [Lentisphaerota bacterium]MCP4100153.1 hypothetical protein [Lentisphaerota bacterium]
MPDLISLSRSPVAFFFAKGGCGMHFFVLLLSLLLFVIPVSAQDSYLSDSSLMRRRLPLSEYTVNNLGKYSLLLAQQKLAINPKDGKGLVLLKLANHLIPDNRYVLLLRGRLKFKVKIEQPETKVNTKEFLAMLEKARERIDETDTAMNRHLMAVINQMVRLFDPEDEVAIITLMKFTDKGIDIDLNSLLTQKLTSITNVEYDPKDPRYAISNVKRSISVPANRPWTETWVKVKAGKMVYVSARGTWSMGNELKFPVCDGNGYVGYDIQELTGNNKIVDKKKKKDIRAFLKSSRIGSPGGLMAKIGKKEYFVGRDGSFMAESSGILYLGPYEWAGYMDNNGSLDVTVEVKDR